MLMGMVMRIEFAATECLQPVRAMSVLSSRGLRARGEPELRRPLSYQLARLHQVIRARSRR